MLTAELLGQIPCVGFKENTNELLIENGLLMEINDEIANITMLINEV